MAITNAEAIRFCNEIIRPLAEKMRNLDAEIDAAMVQWFAGLNTTIGSSGDDDLQDGREDEGVSRLTGADITNFVTQLAATQTAHDAAGVEGVISKPCVRTLSVQ